ncbi:MAG: glycosyltransferase family 39 protein, partial [Patescibacteria group bacterium]
MLSAVLKLGKFKLLLLSLVLLISGFLRFTELGYSHFYGDETKAVYYKKNIGAKEYFLSQRRPPLQFIFSWGTEKLSGGFDEGAIRLPFAIAGFLCSVLVFLIIYTAFGYWQGLLSTLIFSTNGFYIAYSRTVQYQSLFLLFGLTALFLAVLFWKKPKKTYLVCAGVSMAMALLSHYDAVFFFVPVLYFLFTAPHNKNTSVIKTLLYFLVPATLIPAAFYVPYFFSTYFTKNTYIYLQQRFSGTGLLPSSSLFTYFVYNPFKLTALIVLALTIASVLLCGYKKMLPFILWTLVPFIVFEFIFSNPGTHIHNYVLPLLLTAGVGFVAVYEELPKVFMLPVLVLFILNAVLQSFIFIPHLNRGYPWTDSEYGNVSLAKIPKDKYQIFIYGFPYNRGWDQLRDYFKSTKFTVPGGFNYSTNDNGVIGDYYLHP